MFIKLINFYMFYITYNFSCNCKFCVLSYILHRIEMAGLCFMKQFLFWLYFFYSRSMILETKKLNTKAQQFNVWIVMLYYKLLLHTHFFKCCIATLFLTCVKLNKFLVENFSFNVSSILLSLLVTSDDNLFTMYLF